MSQDVRDASKGSGLDPRLQRLAEGYSGVDEFHGEVVVEQRYPGGVIGFRGLVRDPIGLAFLLLLLAVVGLAALTLHHGAEPVVVLAVACVVFVAVLAILAVTQMAGPRRRPGSVAGDDQGVPGGR